MRLPAYPLITVDPFFSIWSRSETLYDAPTTLWCGIPKRLTGFVTVDGKKFRFLGKGKGAVIEQKDLVVTPYVTEYTFSNSAVSLNVRFWTPLTRAPLLITSLRCLTAPLMTFPSHFVCMRNFAMTAMQNRWKRNWSRQGTVPPHVWVAQTKNR